MHSFLRVSQIIFNRLPTKLAELFICLFCHHPEPIALVLANSHRNGFEADYRVFLASLVNSKGFFIHLQKICIQGLFYNVRPCFLALFDPVFKPFAYLLG